MSFQFSASAFMLALAMALLIACEQQTWELTMAAGQRALQKGDYSQAEHISVWTNR
jgi:hypothetical protein